MDDFHGAKGALLIGGRLLITLRDDVPWITHPGRWDLPGGGREGDEGPRDCLEREVMEEVGLSLDAADRLWERPFPSGTKPGAVSWFFALRLPAAAEGRIVLGDEGQGWRLVAPEAFVAMAGAVPFLQDRVAAWLAALAPGRGFP